MKELDFLNSLKEKNKLELVESSEEICNSYLEKAENCMRSAKLLSENDLYENSVSTAYYTMYNSIIALLFRIGIKSENHSGSIILFKKLFDEPNLVGLISFAKKERIDKQYYVNSKKNIDLTIESTKDMVEKAENFLISIKIVIKNLNNGNINKIRGIFESL